MPIYDYKCDRCNVPSTHLMTIADRDKPPRCNHCGYEGQTRLVSGGHFRLKGAGWYATDFKHH